LDDDFGNPDGIGITRVPPSQIAGVGGNRLSKAGTIRLILSISNAQI